MSKLTLAALLVLAAGACRGPRDTVPSADDAAEILGVLARQQSAWNAGDVEAFMSEGYLRSEELTFFSGGNVTRGFEPVLERYRRRYLSEGRAMGTLAFDDLAVIAASGDLAVATGRWRLDLPVEGPLGGLFTLAFVRAPDGWRIRHDHTSADEAPAE